MQSKLIDIIVSKPVDKWCSRYHGGFFVENSFVLVNGTYDDKILHVASMILPAGEKYSFSR